MFRFKLFSMRRIFTLLLLVISLSSCEILNQLPTSTTGIGGITEAEAAQGIKEALGQGLTKAVLQLNSNDGFFKDAFYKILLRRMPKKLKIHCGVSALVTR